MPLLVPLDAAPQPFAYAPLLIIVLLGIVAVVLILLILRRVLGRRR